MWVGPLDAEGCFPDLRRQQQRQHKGINQSPSLPFPALNRQGEVDVSKGFPSPDHSALENTPQHPRHNQVLRVINEMEVHKPIYGPVTLPAHFTFGFVNGGRLHAPIAQRER